ncbi:carboxypeptidase-like regulatory domain-containing protein, partial [bacterium]|nr:carboxypeptidase-like regulatory domain-containing protein [bacterium]
MRYIVLALYVGFSFGIHAQSTATVKGTVKDEQGEPLLGASVIYRADVSKGTIARDDGSFELIVPPGQCKLICRYTGMRSDTVSFDLSPNEQKIVDFTLFSY